MAELGVAYISVIPDTSKLAAGIKGAAAPAADTAGQESGKRFGGRFSSAIGGALKTAGKAGLIGAGVAAGATILGGVKAAVNQEKSEATLAGLYGSAKTASKLMKDLKKVASTSTIDYSTYTKAAEALAYMGIEGKDAPKMLENIGDAISGAGGGADEMDRAGDALLKMVNAGKVELDSLNQLSDAGVPIYSALASQQGESIANVRKMVTEGKIGIEDVQKAIADAEGKSFKKQIKAAKEVEKTLSGRFAILKDNVVSSLGTMFQPGIAAASDFVGKVNAALFEGGGGGGLLSRLKGIAAQVGTALRPLWDAAKNVFAAIGDAARDIFPALINIGKALAPFAKILATLAVGTLVVWWNVLAVAIRAVGKVLGWVGDFAQNHTTTFRVLAGTILGGIAAWKAYRIAMATTAAIQKAFAAQTITTRIGLVALRVQTIATAVAQKAAAVGARLFAAAQWLVNAAMRANPIGIVITALTLLAGGLVLAMRKSATFRKIVQGAWRGIQTAVKAAWNFIRPILRALWSFIQNTLGPIFKWLYNNVIRRYFQLYGKIISTAWNGVIKPIFKAIGQVLRGDLSGAFNTLKDAASRAFNGVINAIKAVPGKIRALAGKFKDAGKWIIGALIDGLSKAGRFVSDIAGNVWNAIRGMLNAAIKKINAALDFKISLPGPDIRVNVPDIPQLARGGRVKRSTLAMIGEGREPESVLPDSMLRGLLARAHAGGAQRGQVDNRRLFAAIRVLVDQLSKKVVPALLRLTKQQAASGSLVPRRTKTPAVTTPVKRAPRRDADAAQRRKSMANQRRDQLAPNLLKGFDKPFKKTGPTLKAFQKNMKRSRAEAQRLNVAVKKGNSKQVRDWVQLRNRGLKPLAKQWKRTHESNARDSKRLNTANSRQIKGVSSTFQRFRRGQLRGFSKDWGTTFRKKTPDDVSTFRKRTGDHMGRTRDTIRKTWSNGIKPTLQTFGSFTKKTVAPAFGRGVDAVGKQWNRIRSKIRGPVKYVITSVINGALIGAFNKIAKFVDAKEIGKVSLPKGFAAGGWTGRGSRFKPAGLVHADEFVVNKPSRRKFERKHPGALDAINRTGDLPNDRRLRPSSRDRRWIPMPGYWTGGGVLPLPSATSISKHGTPYYGAWYASDMNGPYDGTLAAKIAAWKDGMVAYTKASNSSYGYETVINHPDGNFTRYAHQLPGSQVVRSGQKVRMGQRIGAVGETGNAQGAHLHFEIKGGKQAAIQGLGGALGPSLPSWAQKIMRSPKKWARGLLGDKVEGGGFGALVQGALDTLIKPSADWASKQLGTYGPTAYKGPMTGAVTRFVPVIKDVLKALGEPAGETLMSAILARMNQESGGNVGVVNKWDSNWSAGHPSVGLMQVIGPTYQSNKPRPDKGPYKYGTSIDPYSNIYAGLHYARGRYGAIYPAMVKSGGYDKGGRATGVGLMPKHTIEPEQVLSPRQTRSFDHMVRANFRPNAGQSNRLERVEMVITNWDKGTGYIRGIAAAEDGQNYRHARAMGALK